VINQLKQSEQYLDLNLQLGTRQSLYLIYDNDQLFITVGGLTYVDLIFKTQLKSQRLTLHFNETYTETSPVVATAQRVQPDLFD